MFYTVRHDTVRPTDDAKQWLYIWEALCLVAQDLWLHMWLMNPVEICVHQALNQTPAKHQSFLLIFWINDAGQVLWNGGMNYGAWQVRMQAATYKLKHRHSISEN